MLDNILSKPAFYLYLVVVGALLIRALWPREADPPVGEPRATARTNRRGVGEAWVAARCNLDRAPLWSSALPPQCRQRPFRDLQAALSARYAARLEQAIRTIRARPPGRGQPIKRPGESRERAFRSPAGALGRPVTRLGRETGPASQTIVGKSAAAPSGLASTACMSNRTVVAASAGRSFPPE
jgi:hypothetical protein